MGRPVQAAIKRQEILEKSLACFAKYGYSKTTLDDVGRALNMNKTTLYHYFKNKEELFLNALLWVAEKEIGELQEKANLMKHPEKRLEFYFSERLHFYLQMVRLNSLSRENLLQLQGMFDSIYQPVKAGEMTYVSGILCDYMPELSTRKSRELTQLFFEVADAIKHNAVFTGQLIEQLPEDVALVKKTILQTITILLKGIKPST